MDREERLRISRVIHPELGAVVTIENNYTSILVHLLSLNKEPRAHVTAAIKLPGAIPTTGIS